MAARRSTCRFCGDEIMWLTHVRTGKAAPIDWTATPGGNIRINAKAGTYEVLAGDDRVVEDPTVEDPDAPPRLYLNHWSTCRSPHAQRRRTSRPAPLSPQDLAAGNTADD